MTCEPFTGNFTKVKYLPYVTLDVAKDQTDIEMAIENMVIDKYLGSAYYLPTSGNGILHSSCMPETIKPSTVYSPILFRSPVVNSGISQLVEEEIMNEAKAKFKSLLEGGNVAAKGKLQGAFEVELRNQIKGYSNNRADIKWVNVQLQADAGVLRDARYPSECTAFLQERNGSLVTGVAGFVVMASAGNSEYVSERLFKLAAEVAFAAEAITPPTPAIQSAMVEASASWANSSNRKITTLIDTKINKPTFYPLWVQFTNTSTQIQPRRP